MLAWAILALQAVLMGLGTWTLMTLHDHETRLTAVEVWKGDARAYTPEDAKADMARVGRELDRINTALTGHETRMRNLEFIIARSGLSGE